MYIYTFVLSPPHPLHLTAIELGPPLSDSSTNIWKFHALFDSEHKEHNLNHKATIENWLHMGFELESPDCEPAVITKDWEPTEWEFLDTFHFPETMQVLSNPTPITQSNTNLQLKRTKSHHLARDMSEEKLQNPWGNTRNSCTHFFPSFLWSTPETKR